MFTPPRTLSAFLALGSLVASAPAQAPRPVDRDPAANIARAMQQVQINGHPGVGNVNIGNRIANRGQVNPEGDVYGKVVGIDTARNVIQLELLQGEVAYPLAAGAAVFVDNVGGQLTDVPSGSAAQLRIDKDTREVVEIRTRRGNFDLAAWQGGMLGGNRVVGNLVINGRNVANAANGGNVVIGGAGNNIVINGGRVIVNGVEINGPGGNAVSGKVVGIDTARNTVTLELPHGEVSYSLAPEAKVLLEGGKEGRLADVRSGQAALVRLDGDPKQVVELNANRGGRGANGGGRIIVNGVEIDPALLQRPIVRDFPVMPVMPDLPELKAVRDRLAAARAQRGQLVGVDTARKTVTIKTSSGRGGEKTYELAPDAAILINGGKKGKLGDLGAGCTVTFRLNAEGKELVELRAEPTSATGTVDAVDAARKTLTMSNGKKETKTYTLDTDAPVMVNSKNATLDELKPGARVSLQVGADGKTVLRVIATDRRKIEQ